MAASDNSLFDGIVVPSDPKSNDTGYRTRDQEDNFCMGAPEPTMWVCCKCYPGDSLPLFLPITIPKSEFGPARTISADFPTNISVLAVGESGVPTLETGVQELFVPDVILATGEAQREILAGDEIRKPLNAAWTSECLNCCNGGRGVQHFACDTCRGKTAQYEKNIRDIFGTTTTLHQPPPQTVSTM